MANRNDASLQPPVILNPVSGDADHIDRVRHMAVQRGYRVCETQEEGDARVFAKEAATADVELVIICGGDGTIHSVVQGLVEAEALDSITLGLLPAGTANRFATDIGIKGIEHGFEVLNSSEPRRLDLGMTDDDIFVLSCVAGLTTRASESASTELKEHIGSLAFVLTGLREAASFDPLEVTLSGVTESGEFEWSGRILSVLIGNSRRFDHNGGQAHIEDGLLDVTVVRECRPVDIIMDAVAQRLLSHDTKHVARLCAEQLTITSRMDDPIEFSLDGEITTHDQLHLTTQRHTLNIHVGPTYNPSPFA